MREPSLEDFSTANVRESGEEPHPHDTPLLPALTVVSHPLPHRVGDRLLLEGLAAGRDVALSRNAPVFVPPGGALGSHLADPFISRKPLVLAPGPGGSLRLTPAADTRVSLSGEPLQGPWELSSKEVAAGVPLVLAGRVVLLLHLADSAPPRAGDSLGMVGASAGIQRVRRHVEQVADLGVPVLIRGETGSGKELIARAIHQLSPRRERPFVSVNLGAIPRELAASELFGARKGAFTGAVKDQDGYFQAAHGGTLFLDEVGEAPPEVQVMLLRVLETGELYPVGSRTPIAVDVRLVAATDAHLEERIRDGRFKAPLLHRLAGYSIRVPALRERPEDVGPLFHHFAREELEVLGEAHRLSPEDPFTEPWLPAPLAVRMLRHGWPGNIRQLRNVARQLVIGNRGQPRLRLDAQLEQELSADGPPSTGRPATTAMPGPAPAVPRRKPSDVSPEELLTALREGGWDFQAAADRLGIHRTSVYDLIERVPHLRTAGDLSVEEITRCFHACQGDLDAMVRQLEVSRRALGRRLKELGLG
ncbi:sigma 54-interacting transcriptional regulator [Pyxidicoccus sp. MSG2]|uniref:sigma 54-interacting transcriptional regulator n=1 Tax=Pyxidicoccus sp. MSG2 TaxID=2996790 RepID=UPI00226EC69A|nr:sigma-54 dependent transcriptional regulator [Pyxidicoccus sp. MSG2]MCY1020972.1 sigma-54 dependent transcriptional regulator [Pyxidicoccus sp. MSG2]